MGTSRTSILPVRPAASISCLAARSRMVPCGAVTDLPTSPWMVVGPPLAPTSQASPLTESSASRTTFGSLLRARRAGLSPMAATSIAPANSAEATSLPDWKNEYSILSTPAPLSCSARMPSLSPQPSDPAGCPSETWRRCAVCSRLIRRRCCCRQPPRRGRQGSGRCARAGEAWMSLREGSSVADHGSTSVDVEGPGKATVRISLTRRWCLRRPR